MLEVIQDVICSYFGLTKEQLFSKNRVSDIVRPRQWFFYLAVEITGHKSNLHIKKSLDEIAEFGNKNHATVIHSHRVISGFIDTYKDAKLTNKELRQDVDNYSKNLVR